MATFDEILTQVIALLQRDGRVAYRVLKRRFALDDEYIEDLKADLIDAKRLAIDENGKVLAWIVEGEKGEKAKGEKGSLESRVQKSSESGVKTSSLYATSFG